MASKRHDQLFHKRIRRKNYIKKGMFTITGFSETWMKSKTLIAKDIIRRTVKKY